MLAEEARKEEAREEEAGETRGTIVSGVRELGLWVTPWQEEGAGAQGEGRLRAKVREIARQVLDAVALPVPPGLAAAEGYPELAGGEPW